MRRGAVVIVRQKGVYEGKPRPAVVIQGEPFLEHHPSILVCLVTEDQGDEAAAAFYRIRVAPTASNGLKEPSVIMVDKLTAIKRANIGKVVGGLAPATLGRLDAALALFQGLA